MAVTLQQIAEKAGVSRGTVDRALNNRGRIRLEVAERIRKLADEMGYVPNRAGKALAMTKHSICIGVILLEAGTPFIAEMAKGIYRAAEEIHSLGGKTLVREIEESSPELLNDAMLELKEAGAQALVVNPAQNEATKQLIHTFVTDYQIPVVTCNTDIKDSGRLSYFGQDSLQCGRVAAGLMGEILQGKGRVAVISGYATNPSLSQRCEGFCQEVRKSFPAMQLLPLAYSNNSRKLGYAIADQLLTKYRDLAGIFVVASVEAGVCQALVEHGLDRKVKVVSCDYAEESQDYFRNRTISFAITQKADQEGYQAVTTLFNAIFDGKELSQEYHYADLTIITGYNLPNS